MDIADVITSFKDFLKALTSFALSLERINTVTLDVEFMAGFQWWKEY